jgi:hypothetical protein
MRVRLLAARPGSAAPSVASNASRMRTAVASLSVRSWAFIPGMVSVSSAQSAVASRRAPVSSRIRGSA